MTSGKIFASAWSQDRNTAGGTCAAVGNRGPESGESIAPLQETPGSRAGDLPPLLPGGPMVFTIRNESSPIRLIPAYNLDQQDPMTKTAVVALGGNALTRLGQSGTTEEMADNAAAMAACVNDVIEAGWRSLVRQA